MKTLTHSILFVAFALFAITPVFASRAERKAEELAASARPVNVSGGEKFAMPVAYDAAFDAIVKALKTTDQSVAVADRDAGMIATEIEITGGWRQTGTRTVISLTKDTAANTLVRVSVTEQKRFKALQVEPWSDPKLNAPKSVAAAKTLKDQLGLK